MVSVDDITREEFDEILATYPASLKNISKPGKRGEESLEDLDKFRYAEAPSKYCQPDPKNPDQRLIIPLATEDLQKLVAWKLKHGKFRPQLLKLASSNTQTEVTKTSKEAFALYETSPSNPSTILAAVKKLSELKGIGPATASLLLSVHDKDGALFFGDEVFLWLCRDGKVTIKVNNIKYNFKEYEELVKRASAVMKKLGVGAVDIERVGFVVMKEGWSGGKAKTSGKEPREPRQKLNEEPDEKVKEETTNPAIAKKEKKRKSTAEGLEVELRRSKRGKKA